MGEVLYPQSNTIIPALIEIAPIVLVKPAFIHHSFIITQLLLDLCIFTFRMKDKYLNVL